MKTKIIKDLLAKEMYSGAGCGEAKAFAFAAATARKYAPGTITRVSAEGSALFIIGVQTVTIPRTGGRRGGMLAAALGAVNGNADAGLSILNSVTDEDVVAADALIRAGKVSVKMDTEVDSPFPAICLKVTVETDKHTASVELLGGYSNVAFIEQDGTILKDERNCQPPKGVDVINWTELTVEDIYDYCKTCDIVELQHFKPFVEETRIASEDGLKNSYGMQVGRTLKKNVEKGNIAQDEFSYILMFTTAGIDARMNGSPCPTTGNCGSGSQGHINCAAPIASGTYRGSSEEDILRAAVFATLLNIYMDYSTKEFTYLSPMCYCASFGSVAAAAGVAYLHNFIKEQIIDVLRTGLCIVPGIICDGASKATCALRVHAGLSGALHAILIVERGLAVGGHEGFMNDSLEMILHNLRILQRDGMSSVYKVLYSLREEQGNII